jgi:hypothetical protein
MNVDKFNEEITEVIKTFGDDIVVLENTSDYENVIPQMDAIITSVKTAIDSIYDLCKQKNLTATGPQPFGEFVLQASLLLFKHNAEGQDLSNITPAEAEVAAIAIMSNMTIEQMRFALAKSTSEKDHTMFDDEYKVLLGISDGTIKDAFKTYYIKHLTQGA